MTGRHLSIPLDSIKQHPSLQNRNTTTAMRRSRQRAEERAAHISKLAQSIEAKGLEKPLEVVVMTERESEVTSKHYWLVGGHHRYEALTLLKHAEAPAILLEGRGLPEARKLSYQQNDDIIAPLRDDQCIANAWRALNDPQHADFRQMTNKAMATWSRLTDRTIDRMYEVRRRWAAREQDLDYQTLRARAKEQGQVGIRAFNQKLDAYCDQNLMELYSLDFGMLKRELHRGTEEATLEQRQVMRRTAATVMQTLNAYGLEDPQVMRAVLKQVDAILAQAKTYYDACDMADTRYNDNSSANLERYIRLQEDAERFSSVLTPIDDTPDF